MVNLECMKILRIRKNDINKDNETWKKVKTKDFISGSRNISKLKKLLVFEYQPCNVI